MIRKALVFALCLSAGALHAQTPPATATDTAPVRQVFVQVALPYSTAALEPVIDTATMELHYGKHHKAYYEALNKAASTNPALASQALPEVISNISRYPAVVRNNAGGAWNHDFFWATMAPDGQRGMPSAALTKRIDADFGSMTKMKEKFNTAGTSQFGSGWVWLIVRNGKLEVTSTPNQDNPLMDVVDVKGIPILGNDLWEHAYYLKYNNRRAEYLAEWWQVVNWSEVNKRFDAAIARK